MPDPVFVGVAAILVALQVNSVHFSSGSYSKNAVGKVAKMGEKMEISDVTVETGYVNTVPEQIDDVGHRLSHTPFYFVVGILGLGSMLALLYRIANF